MKNNNDIIMSGAKKILDTDIVYSDHIDHGNFGDSDFEKELLNEWAETPIESRGQLIEAIEYTGVKKEYLDILNDCIENGKNAIIVVNELTIAILKTAEELTALASTIKDEYENDDNGGLLNHDQTCTISFICATNEAIEEVFSEFEEKTVELEVINNENC